MAVRDELERRLRGRAVTLGHCARWPAQPMGKQSTVMGYRVAGLISIADIAFEPGQTLVRVAASADALRLRALLGRVRPSR